MLNALPRFSGIRRSATVIRRQWVQRQECSTHAVSGSPGPLQSLDSPHFPKTWESFRRRGRFSGRWWPVCLELRLGSWVRIQAKFGTGFRGIWLVSGQSAFGSNGALAPASKRDRELAPAAPTWREGAPALELAMDVKPTAGRTREPSGYRLQ